MVAFIFTTILMVSLSAMLYLVVRALPRIDEDPSIERHGFLDRWAHSPIPEKVDATLNGFFVKLLRRLKIVVLKIDNALSRHLQKVKPEEMEKRLNIDFKEMGGQNKEGESQS